MIFSRKINHFMKLIEKGSYLKASECLFLTPSALRHSIYELERTVSSKLFYRCNGGVSLTDNGRNLYESLYPIYNKANRIYDEFLQGDSPTGGLKIFIDGLYYPKIVNNLEYIYSKIKKEATIYQVESSSLQKLLMGHCDIAISTTVGEEISVPENISDTILSSENMGFLTSKSTLMKYDSINEMCQSEKIFVRVTTLRHPIHKHLCNRMKLLGINCIFIGLPDISDISTVLASGNGFTLTSAETLADKTFNQDILEFIPNPFSEPFILERHMFYDSNYHPEFRHFADILKK